jgi:hypothetical protein
LTLTMRNLSFEHELRPQDYIMSYPARDDLEKNWFYRPFFKHVENGLVGVEIGAFECNNAYYICKHNQPKMLYLVDPYKKYNDVVGDLGQLSQHAWDSLFELVQERLKDFPVTFVRRPSVEGAALFKDEFFDFCYIDGDHRYEHIVKDINAWFPKVKPGGVFGGHDFDSPEVQQAVNEWLKDNPYTLGKGYNDWWVVK